MLMKKITVIAENGEEIEFLSEPSFQQHDEKYLGLKGECFLSHDKIKKKIEGLVSIFEMSDNLSSKRIEEIKIECGIIIEAGSNVFFASGSTKGSIKLTLTIK